MISLLDCRFPSNTIARFGWELAMVEDKSR